MVKASTNPNSKSLRTTVPIGVISQFGLKEGDRLDWEISFLEGRKVLVVRKVD